MKITQAKNYKKPFYAIGIAAALMAATVSSCSDPGNPIDYAGGMDVRPTETSEVRLAGEVAETDATEESSTETSRLVLDGGAPIDDNDC